MTLLCLCLKWNLRLWDLVISLISSLILLPSSNTRNCLWILPGEQVLYKTSRALVLKLNSSNLVLSTGGLGFTFWYLLLFLPPRETLESHLVSWRLRPAARPFRCTILEIESSTPCPISLLRLPLAREYVIYRHLTLK